MIQGFCTTCHAACLSAYLRASPQTLEESVESRFEREKEREAEGGEEGGEEGVSAAAPAFCASQGFNHCHSGVMAGDALLLKLWADVAPCMDEIL